MSEGEVTTGVIADLQGLLRTCREGGAESAEVEYGAPNGLQLKIKVSFAPGGKVEAAALRPTEPPPPEEVEPAGEVEAERDPLLDGMSPEARVAILRSRDLAKAREGGAL
jgi:hypothetical protein